MDIDSESKRKKEVAEIVTNELIDVINDNWKMFSCITDTKYVKVHNAMVDKIIELGVVK